MSDTALVIKEANSATNTQAADLMERPYARLVMPEPDGTYRGEILEFPGCIATGDTPTDVLSNLEASALAWLTAVIDRGQVIPQPVESTGYSGKLILRLPKSLHKKAARVAERDGVSLNQFIIYALAEQVGEKAKPVSNNYFGASFQMVISGGFLPPNSSSVQIHALTDAMPKNSPDLIPIAFEKIDG